jgi:prepilin-type N-terminal cleavage/methylation domain-containing protein
MKNIKRLVRGGEEGLSLIEVLIAILLLGILSAAILQAGRITSTVSTGVDNKRNAMNLAELQMEFVKGLGYASEYPGVTPQASQFPGYSVSTKVRAVGLDTNNDGITDTLARDTNIQLITITVRHGSGVTGVNFTNGGVNYTSATVVNFIGGGGAGATAIANISGGTIQSVTITGKGSGYTSEPTVTFTDSVGTGAVATATITNSLVTLEGYKTQ